MQRLMMDPSAGERVLRYVGDRIRFSVRPEAGGGLPSGWRAMLRTNLGRAGVIREEIIRSHFQRVPLAGASWWDARMRSGREDWFVELALNEPGYFKAKPYTVDPQGRQHWPEGPDIGIAVHPDSCRTANTIYCAFVRLFGESRSLVCARDARSEGRFKALDEKGYTVIPPSGRLRDLIRQIPHILDTLGCRIVHVLPINPAPTTYARMGRFGSPYACQDLTAIDPALVEFDRRTTGVEQFRELAYAVHCRGGRLFLDLAINHTGWGATLHENHPEWFVRRADGTFASPGAWGVVWEDLVELDQRWHELWEYFADVFLAWCRRGVDGFRCDAGYKIPVPAWQHIIARVRREFPETVFLLEGLGGAWEITENLLTEGGMQWAYSELFQNYSGLQVSGYLDHSHHQSARAGSLIHYSETHDNDRLAARGRQWSVLRNRLCALTSVSGGYGFTCGVEWLATEKILVHQNAGLAWGRPDNLVSEIAGLNRLLADHPCFFEGAKLTRLSSPESPIYALRRTSAEGTDSVLVLVNTDLENPRMISIDEELLEGIGRASVDLLGQATVETKRSAAGKVAWVVPPAGCACLAAVAQPRGRRGEVYRRARAQAAWAISTLSRVFPLEEIGPYEWWRLAEWVEATPEKFLAATVNLERAAARSDLLTALEAAARARAYPRVVSWSLEDRRRIVPVPPGHWLLIREVSRFRATLESEDGSSPAHADSISVRGGHVACFLAPAVAGEARLTLERYGDADPHVSGALRFLAVRPDLKARDPASGLVLLTNGLGGMARLGVDLGRVRSKYDCLLGANLHPTLPVDRHILAKRARVWINADGFITPLNGGNLVAFESGPPARWQFLANAGNGRSVTIELIADMLDQRNATVLQFHRPDQPPAAGADLPDGCDVSLTVRLDVEDRNFHTETRRNWEAERHFNEHCRPLPDRVGFEFAPAPDRRLLAVAERGFYHHEGEWSEHIPHPVDQQRGQEAEGDAFSPGWFELPLAKGAAVTLTVSAGRSVETVISSEVEDFIGARRTQNSEALRRAGCAPDDALGRQLTLAARQFVVRRGDGKTIVAGYPWFLDWGRDSLICARGLLVAGLVAEVQELLALFGRLVDRGTLPNTIHGEDASNRDTSDAPLWYGVACEESAGLVGGHFYEALVGGSGDTFRDVLRRIAVGYCDGTPNGIRMDASSGLVWSPRHFTWMDTNYPAGTPRQGYPVEIQALWIRLLRQLSRIADPAERSKWGGLADRAQASLQQYYWLEEPGYLADVLLAEPSQPPARAVVDTALRSNGLLAVSLGLVDGERAQRCVESASRHLVVPGALRSLAPLPVSPPLPIHASDGRLLNDPGKPYWGRYEGDEDTRRKPAYHNGTAWTWPFPVFCEALARAWNFSAPATAAARAYLGAVGRLMTESCLGQIPEILDGDTPHTQRGCDAQAWGVTEALRIWKLLNAREENIPSG